MGARYCDACGSPIARSDRTAEFKQVTVLFADVVHSMDIAATVGPERLREIMTELVDRSASVVQRYGGTLDKFTGDGIMALFGAPITLEDHAFRACLAALEIQRQVDLLSVDIKHDDRIKLRVRIGLNSGQVIAGEMGSASASYTAIGEQVGLAQRMESIAPPGGVMLSESTARLVERSTVLGDSELVELRGADTRVHARKLLGIGERGQGPRIESTLVGRTWELNTLTGILDEAAGGAGSVVTIVGPPGIGKSRLVRETAAIAYGRGVGVFNTFCESHSSGISFHAAARLLRAGMQVDDLDDEAARSRVCGQFPGADPEDLVLIDDLLGIRDAAVCLPEIAPDARRRRLTALFNSFALARREPAVYVIEDAHWIDEASESMLVDFLTVTPQTHALVLITYRPEYTGPLSRVPDADSIALRPLSDEHSLVLTAHLLGADPSVDELAAQVSARAAGNPFFVEEMVRDLAERGVLHGDLGTYRLVGDAADVRVPATLQATIGARIDRLWPAVKFTLNAAAVIGSRFDAELLSALLDTVDINPLIDAQLVEQVRFAPRSEFAFRHPLIRTVAYESQLKSDRARLHRRLASAIEARGSPDENSTLIAEHLEAAGDLHGAYAWHMRAGTWSTNRDLGAAQTSWRRARQVADRLPDADPERTSMRIAPQTLLTGNAWRGGSGAQTGFDELRELCIAAGDTRSLAIGMPGLVTLQLMNARRREASLLATELVRLLESLDDPMLTVGLSFAAMGAKHETGEMAEILRLANRVIELAADDLTKGALIYSSPLTSALAMRGIARACLGIKGWRGDIDRAITRARSVDATAIAAVMLYTYIILIPYGLLLADAKALRDTADALAMAEQSGDDLALDLMRAVRAVTLVHREGAERDAGFELFAKIRERALNKRFSLTVLPISDIHIAREKVRLGDDDAAIGLARTVLDDLFASGMCIWIALATSVLVEALVQRHGDGDLKDAQAAIDRLAAVPTDPGFVLHEITVLRLRVLLARYENEDGYLSLRDRYRKMATDLGFEGHMAWAEAIT